jgi:SAM-dependent methyltransferase
MATHADQLGSSGSSTDAIVAAAFAAARPQPGLLWLDIGCGRGDLLRTIKRRAEPRGLRAIDAIDWLDADLRNDVDFHLASADNLDVSEPADRVLLVEVIEHLEAPWTALRQAARLVAPGGRIVVSTPNLATVRTRLELGLRGNLTSFRPGYEPHLSPALPHVTARVLAEEGLNVQPPSFAGPDVISLTGGRLWPERVRVRFPRLLSVSVIVVADRPEEREA